MLSCILNYILLCYVKTIRCTVLDYPTLPAIFALWHRDLPASIYAFKEKNIHVQISSSHDATLAHALCKKLGYTTHAGSSSSLQASIRSLLNALNSGHSVGVALDGPRGPAGICSPGALWLHTQSGSPLYVISVSYTAYFCIPSWDKMRFPLPFSKIFVTLIPHKTPTKNAIESEYTLP